MLNADTYLTEPPLDCSISAFGGIEDSGETPELIESWSVQTSSLFFLEMLPDDHFFVNSSRQLFLEILSRKIEQVMLLILCKIFYIVILLELGSAR